MSIRFRCQHCSNPMEVPDRAAGKRVQCKKCGAICSIPMESQLEVKKTADAELLANLVPLPSDLNSPTEDNSEDSDELCLAPYHDASPLTDVPTAPYIPPVPTPTPTPKPSTAASKPTAVAFQCLACQQRIKVSALSLGKKVKCPFCTEVQKVPKRAQLVVSDDLAPTSPKPTTSKQASPKPAASAPIHAESIALAPLLPELEPLVPESFFPESIPEKPAPTPTPKPTTKSIASIPIPPPVSSTPQNTTHPVSENSPLEDEMSALLDDFAQSASTNGFDLPTNSSQILSSTVPAKPLRPLPSGMFVSSSPGDVVNGIMKVYFGNFGTFTVMGLVLLLSMIGTFVLYLLLCGGVGFIFAFNGWSLDSLPIVIRILLVVVMCLFWSAAHLGGIRNAIKIAKGMKSESLFGFHSGEYFCSLGINIPIYAACILAGYTMTQISGAAAGLLASEHAPETKAAAELWFNQMNNLGSISAYIILTLPIWWAYALITDRQERFGPALVQSLVFFGMNILSILLVFPFIVVPGMFVGTLLCGIGLPLIGFPLFYCSVAVIYLNGTGQHVALTHSSKRARHDNW